MREAEKDVAIDYIHYFFRKTPATLSMEALTEGVGYWSPELGRLRTQITVERFAQAKLNN